MRSLLLSCVYVYFSRVFRVDSFAPTNFSHHGIYVKGLRREAKSLRMSNQFDVSRPVFDLLALRTVRGDALIRYDALNQSEPLRITLYTLLAMSCFAVPSLSQAVGYDELSLPATVGSYAVGFSSVGLLVRECTRRSRQLTRIEKELNTETLPIRLPTNILADVPYTRPTTLKDLRNLSNPPRIIAISGTKAKLDQALVGLSVFGRRLQQATVYVVIVPTDGSKISELTIPATSSSIPWLADASNQIVWQEYFQSLTSDRKGSTNQMASFQWFGLNSSGRSFGSGEEEIPLWLQLLGQHLRPTEILGDADDSFPNADPMLLESVASFYGSLTTGDFKGIGTIFSSNESPQVSEVILAGGRIDSWKDCLADGARPEGMKFSGADTLIVSDTESYSTVVEFPSNAGVESATLLAVQKWTRTSQKDSWKLDLHQTIPWSPENKAQGTLRCDCRGCVALTRSPERRTFGGIVG